MNNFNTIKIKTQKYIQKPMQEKISNINLNIKPKEPLWGCLKNGKKPTYSQYKKSLKFKKEKIKIGNKINDLDNNLNNNTNILNNESCSNNQNNLKVKYELNNNKLENNKKKNKK